MKKYFYISLFIFMFPAIVWGTEYSFDEIQECENASETQCDLSGRPITGKVVSHSSKGGFEFTFENGKLNGITKIYYENGRPRAEISFKENEMTSGYLYSKNGNRRVEMTDEYAEKVKRYIFVAAFEDGYNSSMTKYRANEIANIGAMLAIFARDKGTEIKLIDSDITYGIEVLDTTLTRAGKPEGQYNTSAVIIKLLQPNPELCDSIMSRFPHTPPTSSSDDSAKAGFYILSCS